MTPLRLVLAGAAGSAAADFGDQDPRGLTHRVIGSPVVRVGMCPPESGAKARSSFDSLAEHEGFEPSVPL